MFDVCFELFLRVFVPRLPAIFKQICPDLKLTESPPLEDNINSSQFVFVNNWASRGHLFDSGKGSNMLAAVTSRLYPPLYDLFASIDQMLCLSYAAMENSDRLATLIRGVFVWYLIEESTSQSIHQSYLKRHSHILKAPLLDDNKLNYNHMVTARRYAIPSTKADPLYGWGVILDSLSNCSAQVWGTR
jgi:quinol monooxygenase YgiN